MDNVIQHIKIEDIVPRNHRYNLSDIKSLEDLAISIKENGIKEPLILKKTKDKYENKGLALAAYNAGIGTVDNWIDKNVIRADRF